MLPKKLLFLFFLLHFDTCLSFLAHARLGPPTFRLYSTSLDQKEKILNLLQQTPKNAPTPRGLTSQILQEIRELERLCPNDQVLDRLSGNWELVWTTQDRSSSESQRITSWINPLENQSYSNNPSGRSDPFLPVGVQERLEKMGIVSSEKDSSIRSTQSIDLKRQRVRNVVAFVLPGRQKASLTVDISFTPDRDDSRKIIVKFNACRVVLPGTPIDINIPLGFVGPTGWLRTTYIDESFRITRGHKGSVFVLTRRR